MSAGKTGKSDPDRLTRRSFRCSGIEIKGKTDTSGTADTDLSGTAVVKVYQDVSVKIFSRQRIGSMQSGLLIGGENGGYIAFDIFMEFFMLSIFG